MKKRVDDGHKYRGSESRDLFKGLHYDHPESSADLYALDIDLSLVGKKPYPHIICFIDFKAGMMDDTVKFSEVIAYNQSIQFGIPVYIVESGPWFHLKSPDEHRLNIYEYQESPDDPVPDPPDVNMTLLEEDLTWGEFFDWERDVRKADVIQRKKELENND